MAVKFKITPLTFQQLDALIKPQDPNQPEVIPWTWYDSQDIATTVTSQSFFANTSNDPSISNIEQPNTFSSDQYSRLHAVTIDWLIGASQTNNAAAQIVDDLLNIYNTARFVFNLFIGQKQYMQVPIHGIHSSGGLNIAVQGTPATNNLFNYAQNWAPDGGYATGGAIIFPPKQTFKANLSGQATTLTATRKCRVTFHVELFRLIK